MQDTSWSLGTLIGLPALALLFAAAVGVAIWAFVQRSKTTDSYRRGDYAMIGFIAAPIALVVLVIAAWGFYPYSAEYHQWRTVSGDVTDVNSRLVSAGKSSVNQRFVVEIDGHAYGCDDTRCASVKIGDRLTISCKREWQYAGVDGYGCNFVRNEAHS